MKVDHALLKLSRAGITNDARTLRKWLREGKIRATIEKRSEGYEIDETSLEQFISDRLAPHEAYFRKKFEGEHNIAEMSNEIWDLKRKLDAANQRVQVYKESLAERNKELKELKSR